MLILCLCSLSFPSPPPALQGSPTSINVLPAAAGVAQCELVPPEGVDALPAGDLEAPSSALIKTRDKFGNACITGGLRIAGRLNLVKQSSTDNTILMPNNHVVTIEDNEVRHANRALARRETMPLGFFSSSHLIAPDPPLPPTLARPYLLHTLHICSPLRMAPTSSTWRR